MINTLQNSLSQAKELIDGMSEQIKMYDSVIDSMIANHGFNHRLRDVLAKMSKEAVDALDSNKVDKIIAFTQSKLNEINAAKDEDTDEKKAMTFSEYCISVFKEIYDCCVNYADAIKERIAWKRKSGILPIRAMMLLLLVRLVLRKLNLFRSSLMMKLIRSRRSRFRRCWILSVRQKIYLS